jgi:hypothetical protein
VIPDEAVEAAARASWEKANSDPWISGDHDDERWADRRVYLDDARVMLEAAAPHMLSHEREQTRLAHLDAVVNARTVDKLNNAVEAVLALVDANTLNGVVIVSAARIRAAITKALQ